MTAEPTALTIRKPPAEAIAQLERVVLEGNLATLNDGERVAYYARVCESLGLNPLTRPFEYITLNNKLTLYVRKDATDQLRDLHGVSIPSLERERDDELGLFTVIAHAVDRYGREDSGMGVVSIKGLSGENLANAMMKAETKAKRRATLSICGLGWMDEIEAVDQRAIEVAPRAALAGGIAARRAAMTSGSSEAPAGPVSAEEGGGSSVLPTPPSSEPACTHDAEYVATPQGLECPKCGKLVAAYDGEVVPEPKPAPRGRRKAPAAKKPGDDGYGTARAHAVAAERGLDHDAVHRIARDVLGAPSAVMDPETREVKDFPFSVKNLDEDQWAEVIAAISEAPIMGTQADPDEWKADAEEFAGRMALQAGLGEGDDPWPQAEPAAVEMFGVAKADELTSAQWIEFGIRVYARNPLP